MLRTRRPTLTLYAGAGALPSVLAQQCPSVVHSDVVATTGADDGMSLEEQMVSLALAAYNRCNATEYPDTTVAGWQQVVQLEIVSSWQGMWDSDMYTVYSRRGECALAVAGSNSDSDFVSNFDGFTTATCGFEEVHRGFSNKLGSLLGHPEWSALIQPYLNSSSCSAGVALVGHSLGGAEASLLAACANNGSRPFGFAAKTVYTIGSPGLSKKPLSNRDVDGECFSGARFYNEDELLVADSFRVGTKVDPVTSVAQTLGFHHLKVPAVRLRRNTDAPYWRFQVFACEGDCAASYPGVGMPEFSLHDGSEYIVRVRRAFTDQNATESTSSCQAFNSTGSETTTEADATSTTASANGSADRQAVAATVSRATSDSAAVVVQVLAMLSVWAGESRRFVW